MRHEHERGTHPGASPYGSAPAHAGQIGSRSSMAVPQANRTGWFFMDPRVGIQNELSQTNHSNRTGRQSSHLQVHQRPLLGEAARRFYDDTGSRTADQCRAILSSDGQKEKARFRRDRAIPDRKNLLNDELFALRPRLRDYSSRIRRAVFSSVINALAIRRPRAALMAGTRSLPDCTRTVGRVAGIGSAKDVSRL